MNDPVTEAIAPMHSLSNSAHQSDEDSRDSLFGGPNEQTYASPAAPILTPPIEDNPESQQQQQENIAKTQAIRPLL